MPYIVAGTLTLPESTKPATNVTITFRNLMTVSPLIVASESSVTTSATGTYSISLQYSVYAVEVTYYNNRPISAGQILLNSETQTGLDLPTLLNGGEYEPATPAWILQIEAWLVEAQNSATASANSAQASQAQANASAASAADSAASAAQASQISGLSTVSEAIGLAMAPLPDVWAPLSDSLRLITGYGRDVLVGSDVVARMVNFSRNSTATYIGKDGQRKTAAANEPRFEKEGLLIEGQSTNLFPWSQEFIGKWARVDAIASPDSNFPNAVALKGGAEGYVHTSAGNLTIGAAYTITAIVTGYVEGATQLRGRFANSPQESHRVVGQYGPYTVLSFSLGSAANSNPNVTGIYWEAGYANGVTLCAMQVEALPFASSYIPTNGAAGTRAADIMTIPCALNWPANVQNERTVAAQVVNMRFTSGYPRMFTYDSGNGGIWYDGTQFASNEMNPVGRFYVTKDKLSEPHVHAEVHNKDYLQCYMSNVGMGPKGVRGSNPTYKADIQLCTFPYCHIRNVRIWHKVLNDSQIKAIA